MADSRHPDTKLLDDTMRYKRQRNEARADADRLAALLAEMQLQMIAGRVRGRLLRFEDFHHQITVGAVVSADGRVNLRKLDLMVSDLLRRRPELGVSHPNDGPIRYNTDDGSDTAGGILYPVESSPVGNTQQSGACA